MTLSVYLKVDSKAFNYEWLGVKDKAARSRDFHKVDFVNDNEVQVPCLLQCCL